MTTSPDRWSRISALFDELVELDADRRTRRLAQLAASDPELVEEVRALLAADEDISGLLDGDAAAAVPGMLAYTAGADSTVADLLATMRIAGGSVIAPHSPRSRRALQPRCAPFPSG